MFNPKPINENIQQLLIELVEQQTGLKIRSSERDNFLKKVQERIKFLHLQTAEDYYSLLSNLDFISQNEWKELATLITNTESYFFRDQGQFLLLKEQILPELIERKKTTKHLKIWSAGCSTGEEPYSLAILLRELIDNISQWDLQLLATDLNKNAIARAKQGIYSAWSFRNLDQNIITKYFHKIHNEYQINANIRQMIQFELLNLKSDYFPQEAGLIHHIDLIICRNVFIYFSKDTVGYVVNKLAQSLNPLGYLLTGHAELYGQTLSNLETKIFRESIIYQRPDSDSISANQSLNWYLTSPFESANSISDRPIINTILNKPLPVKEPPLLPLKNQELININLPKLETIPTNSPQINSAESLLMVAQEQFKKKQYQLALEIVDRVISINPKSGEANYLKGKILANIGQYQEAKKICQSVINLLEPFNIKIHYLLAQIAEETKDFELAKAQFRKIIYLDNNAISAYVGLAYLYRQEKNFAKSRKMYETVLTLLQKIKPDQAIEGHHLTGMELKLEIEKELGNLET